MFVKGGRVLIASKNLLIKQLMTVLILNLVHLPAHAFFFEPTEAEFNLWPDYCRGMYAGTNVGRKTGYWRKVPKSEIDKWYPIGAKNGGGWHYCGGLARLTRAQAEYNPLKRAKSYRRAYGDIKYSFDRVDPTSLWAAKYSVGLARALRGMNEHDKAINVLKEAIRNHPKHINAYLLSSQIYQDKKDFQSAKTILVDANDAMNGTSSEVYYFLGLLAIKMGSIDEAREYANNAYRLGYPLQGLKNKLKKYPDKDSRQ